MNQPFHNTGFMLRLLLKRDGLKYLFWLLGLLIYAASGVGKLELAVTTATKQSMYALFNGPALVSLFGPTSVSDWQHFTAAAAFGGLMPLTTGLVFSIITMIYVINRTRKEEDEGITELLRSFQIGKLSNTLSVVLELFCLQVILTFALALSIQLQHALGMTHFSQNLLFASAITSQSVMWGMIALLFAQLFPEASPAKGASIGFFGLLYIIRMGTDIKDIALSWFNPLSWSYLTGVYVKNNWLPILYTLLFAAVMLVIALVLEIRRDVAVGYLPQSKARAHAGYFLSTFQGLVLRLQRISALGWVFGLFVLGLTYGSMISKIGTLVGGNSNTNHLLQKELQITQGSNQMVMKQQFLSTIYVVLALIATCFAITLLNKMVSEERHQRQEQLYALPNSRFSVYLTYVLSAFGLGTLAQLGGILGIYVAQAGQKNAVSFSAMIKGGLPFVIGIWFVLGILCLLIAFLPRFSNAIWVYVGLSFFLSMIGPILDLPQGMLKLNVFDWIMKTNSAPNTLNIPSLFVLVFLTLIMIALGFVAYKKRDIISG